MTRTDLLCNYIEKSGLKKSFIAQALGLTRQAFLNKCNNKVEFKASEIESLCKILNIPVKERMAIFFAK